MISTDVMELLARHDRIFSISELNQHYRLIVDEARSVGLATVRDRDGELFFIVPAHGSVMTSETLWRHFGHAVSSLVAVERISSGAVPILSATTVGPWTWVASLPKEDLPSFVDDLRGAIERAIDAHDPGLIDDAMAGWVAAARAARDPLFRTVRESAGDPSSWIVADAPREIETSPG